MTAPVIEFDAMSDSMDAELDAAAWQVTIQLTREQSSTVG